MDIILASKTPPKKPKIDARFIGVKEITSRLVAMRLSDWNARVWRRFGPTYVLLFVLAYLVANLPRPTGANGPSINVVASVANGFSIAIVILVVVFGPMILVEQAVLAFRARRRCTTLNTMQPDQQETTTPVDRSTVHVPPAGTAYSETDDAVPQPHMHANGNRTQSKH